MIKAYTNKKEKQHKNVIINKILSSLKKIKK